MSSLHWPILHICTVGGVARLKQKERIKNQFETLFKRSSYTTFDQIGEACYVILMGRSRSRLNLSRVVLIRYEDPYNVWLQVLLSVKENLHLQDKVTATRFQASMKIAECVKSSFPLSVNCGRHYMHEHVIFLFYSKLYTLLCNCCILNEQNLLLIFVDSYYYFLVGFY